MLHPIYRIVLTGGPCAGKSTSLSRISERFSSLGFQVFVVPEVASLMILSGVSLRGDSGHTFQTQTELLKTQLHLEKSYLRLAQQCKQPCLIIYDRGAMDAAAFIQPEMWQSILDGGGWSNIGLRDQHYEAVIHLQTAAIGAEEFYTLENNAARTESAKEAAEVDERIRNAWLGHPHLRVIDNSTDFEGKILRVLQAISNVIGIPQPIENERKFLVRSEGDFYQLVPGASQISLISQTYLISESSDIDRVRKRGDLDGHHNTYTFTSKKFLSAGKNIERQRIITGKEYLSLLEKKDPTKKTIQKHRQCFLYENQYFELDLFLDRPLRLLEVELEDENSQPNLPPFISIEKEVTDDPAYSNANLASIS